MNTFSEKTYTNALKIIGLTYKGKPGIIDVVSDSWLDDIIILVDGKYELPVIPNKILGFQVRIINPYTEVEQLSYVIDDLVVNEPALWDDNSPIKSFEMIRDHYVKVIKQYEGQ